MTLLVTAKNVRRGDRLYRIGSYFDVEWVQQRTEALTFKRLTIVSLNGHGEVTMPAYNTVRVERPVLVPRR